jgi:hypothetical protein
LTKEETLPISFIVASNMATSSGVVLIPQGSEVKGRITPFSGWHSICGTTINFTQWRTYNLNATSNVITKTERVSRGTDLGNLLKNAALGTAAAAAIAAVTGDNAIATEELLIGAGAGILATLIPQFLGMNSIDLLVVEPES